MGVKCWMMSVGCWAMTAHAQEAAFSLQQRHDSLYVLTLTTDSTTDHWQLPYPVYRMQTGDVNGDGSIDALVGVIKTTRFYPEKAQRLFIFKNYHGLVRPLWLGSKLGGSLQDFRFIDGRVRGLETTTDGRYVVAEYRWSGFGMVLERYLAKGTDRDEAIRIFNM